VIPARRSCAVYAITRHGVEIARRIVSDWPDADLFVSEKLASLAPATARPFRLPMGPLLSDTFAIYDAHVFVISVGAVVRMIAPLLQNKKIDPAVVCVDDAARFSICVLSGHVGRGNVFTERVAKALEATPVVTTASDAIGTLTVDILARDLGWTLDDMDRNVTRACAAVVNETRVLFVQETGEPTWWPLDKPLPKGVEYATSLDGVDPDAYEMLLIASARDVARTHPRHFAKSVVYRPKSLVLGIGCDRNTPLALIERGIESILGAHGLSSKAVRSLSTIAAKGDEPALLALSSARRWPLEIFAAESLDALGASDGVESPSERVKAFVGARGVCEPAALLAAGAKRLLVAKQKYTEEGAGRSMTLAVAEIPFARRSTEVAHA
jgi:cobalt-precorrin 5A hydrolase